MRKALWNHLQTSYKTYVFLMFFLYQQHHHNIFFLTCFTFFSSKKSPLLCFSMLSNISSRTLDRPKPTAALLHHWDPRGPGAGAGRDAAALRGRLAGDPGGGGDGGVVRFFFFLCWKKAFHIGMHVFLFLRVGCFSQNLYFYFFLCFQS